MTDKLRHPDADAQKGAVESQSPNDTPPRPDLHSTLADQLPHRKSEDLDGADSDFPEPGATPEHSGQHQ
ncbi:hypothetical protein [Silvibacterium dinghuense]|uniref:Uncharacterized protein n=1 Tax=Silvibacterium dinghuense TaxID=1560006 RepID=A0A4Q1SE83_9BACT|nr:hypothetical protein [Silvibacterium dinghuense]RXS95405.1 hypothetical protein ESZ00_12555 [Silvibacterium dinghuense]GGH12966.1 hypothetical protein GCM10011586_32550 [Silvibacterium dinghuense]